MKVLQIVIIKPDEETIRILTMGLNNDGKGETLEEAELASYDEAGIFDLLGLHINKLHPND